MVIFFLETQDVPSEDLFWVQARQKFQPSVVISVEIDVKQFSIHAVISYNKVNAVDIVTLSALISLLSMVLGVISP